MMKHIDIKDFKIGSETPMLVKNPIEKIHLVKYAGASGDFNPFHTDPDIGKAIGLGQIAQGMLIMRFVGQTITDGVSLKYLKKLSVRFSCVTKLGDIVSITGKVCEKTVGSGSTKIQYDLLAKNQNNELLLNGYFEIILPK